MIAKATGEWDGDARPLFLAPMSGVSELPYRLLARECGADVTITEFTSSSALSREVANSWARLESHVDEKPFIPQIFGGNPVEMVTAAKMLDETADIIDLNFGCPAPKVTKICAGAALMGTPDDLVAMTDSIISEVDSPVSAKMRLGTGSGPDTVLDISKRLEDIGTQRLCIHGRTLRQRYSGEADWNSIANVVKSVEVPVVANGDVFDTKSARTCLEATHADGLMIGRGAIGRPSVFAEIKAGLGWIEEDDLPWADDSWFSSDESTRVFHTRRWCWNRYIELANSTTGLRPKWMMRHAVAFTKGLPGAKKVRKMMHSHTKPEDFATSVTDYLAEGCSES